MEIHNWNEITEECRVQLLQRPTHKIRRDILSQVESIINDVKQFGDKALFNFTERYDNVQLKDLQVSSKEIGEAFDKVSNESLRAMKHAIHNIESYHAKQIPKGYIVQTSNGVVCERNPRAIESVGLYVPGGKTPLISTVMMLAIPAQMAKCHKRILCTPPSKNGVIDPHILVIANLCEVHEIYKVGGAQAIAAMAYGTNTIPRVNKIFGPGNAWVTQAKMQVSLDPNGASIDMPAGPSELLVIADDTANPKYVAADLLSQAEHGADSQVVLMALSVSFAQAVIDNINTQLNALPRKVIAEQSLLYARIFIVTDINQAIQISNAYAPEHLILQLNDSEVYIPKIQNAGAVFIGPWAPETVGDYVTGSNHVLPTNGFARSYSGLGISDFVKFISFQRVTRSGLINMGKTAEILSSLEGLHAHKNAVSIRLGDILNE